MTRTPDGSHVTGMMPAEFTGTQDGQGTHTRVSDLVPAVTPAALSRERLWVAVLLAGAVLVTFYRLGTGALWEQDEPLYTQMAREILRTGDWVTLHFNGAPWYVHPPFYMWLLAATGKVAGFSEVTARFWSAAASVVAVFVTVLIGRRLFTPRTGVLAGAILSVTFQFLIQAHLAVFDTVLLVWMLLAVHAFVRAYQDGDRADSLRFFLFCGLATLTKGPIGLLLPALVIVPFVIIRRAWRRWREVPWAQGLAIYFLIGWSWYAAETWRHGWAFVSPVFGYYGLGRFFGVVEYQTGPWYFYFPVLIVGAFPWTAFWPAAAVRHARRLHVDGSLFVVLWCMVTFTFYFAAGTKIPNYILPIYPFAAIGVAAWWDTALEAPGIERSLSASFALQVVLLCALVAGLARYFAQLYPGAGATLARLAQYHALGHAIAVATAAIVVGLVTASLVLTRAKLPAFIVLCAAMAVTWLGVLPWIVPVIDSHRPIKPLALAIRAQVRPGDRIIGYGSFFTSLVYYTDHDVDWISRPATLHTAVCAPGRIFIVVGRQSLAEVPEILNGLVPLAERNGIQVLLKPASAHCVLIR